MENNLKPGEESFFAKTMDVESLMSLQNISFSYDKAPVLSNISLQVEAGEFIGIIGPNGSGKSTLLKVMGNILQTGQGQCLLRGQPIRDYERKELARNISWLPQESTLIFPFRVLDVILMGRYPHLSPLTFESIEDFKIAHRAMDLTDISDFADRLYSEISGGEKQRVMIASALAQESEMMLLDEPTSSLDIKYQIEILKILQRLNSKEGLTLVLALHDLHLASRYCSRLILLSKGKVVRDGSPTYVLQKETLEEVYGIEVKTHSDPDDGSIMVFPK